MGGEGGGGGPHDNVGGTLLFSFFCVFFTFCFCFCFCRSTANEKIGVVCMDEETPFFPVCAHLLSICGTLLFNVLRPTGSGVRLCRDNRRYRNFRDRDHAGLF